MTLFLKANYKIREFNNTFKNTYLLFEGIVLTGSVGSATEPFNFEDEINKYFKNIYKI